MEGGQDRGVPQHALRRSLKISDLASVWAGAKKLKQEELQCVQLNCIVSVILVPSLAGRTTSVV